MNFTSFTAWSSDALNRKVNGFLAQNPGIEIIDIKFSASFGAVYAAILYR